MRKSLKRLLFFYKSKCWLILPKLKCLALPSGKHIHLKSFMLCQFLTPVWRAPAFLALKLAGILIKCQVLFRWRWLALRLLGKWHTALIGGFISISLHSIHSNPSLEVKHSEIFTKEFYSICQRIIEWCFSVNTCQCPVLQAASHLDSGLRMNSLY